MELRVKPVQVAKVVSIDSVRHRTPFVSHKKMGRRSRLMLVKYFRGTPILSRHDINLTLGYSSYFLLGGKYQVFVDVQRSTPCRSSLQKKKPLKKSYILFINTFFSFIYRYWRSSWSTPRLASSRTTWSQVFIDVQRSSFDRRLVHDLYVLFFSIHTHSNGIL